MRGPEGVRVAGAGLSWGYLVISPESLDSDLYGTTRHIPEPEDILPHLREKMPSVLVE